MKQKTETRTVIKNAVPIVSATPESTANCEAAGPGTNTDDMIDAALSGDAATFLEESRQSGGQ